MATPPYITTAQLKTRLAAALSKAEGDLISKWTQIITDALAAGYRDIRQGVMNPKLGYTQDQLDAWDDNASYVMDQSLFWALVNGAGLSGYDPSTYNKLDHRAEMAKPGFVIFIAGVPAVPGAISGGTATGVLGGQIIQGTGGVDLCTTFRTQAERRREMGQYGAGTGPFLEGWSG